MHGAVLFDLLAALEEKVVSTCRGAARTPVAKTAAPARQVERNFMVTGQSLKVCESVVTDVRISGGEYVTLGKGRRRIEGSKLRFVLKFIYP